MVLKHTIHINSHVQVRDIHAPYKHLYWYDKPTNLEWVEGEIQYNNHFYNVEFSSAGELGTYCSPVKYYPSSEFEEIFNVISEKSYSDSIVILFKNYFM